LKKQTSFYFINGSRLIKKLFYTILKGVFRSPLKLEFENKKFICPIDENWRSSITAYFRAKQYSFDVENRILLAYKFVEFSLVKLWACPDIPDSGLSNFR